MSSKYIFLGFKHRKEVGGNADILVQHAYSGLLTDSPVDLLKLFVSDKYKIRGEEKVAQTNIYC